MYALIFDVETTGLIPKNKTDPPVYITQLSFALYDVNNRQLIKTYNAYINIPKHVSIHPKITQLTGIDREKLNNEGVDIVEALEAFYDAYIRVDIIVAHNLEFDSKVMEIESNRNYERFIDKEKAPHIVWMFDSIYMKLQNVEMKCTMMLSKELCNIERINSRGPYIKFPSLCEMYEKLFHTKPENLHNSMIDVLVCLRCYLKMEHNQTITDEEFSSYLSTVLV
jgi:DNA polymerase III epsilon subunit-like protein